MHEQILVAVDGSKASEQAVGYVAAVLGGHSDRFVHLVHVLPPVPQALKDAEIAEGKSGRWLEGARAKAHELLEGFAARIASAGLPRERIDLDVLASEDPERSMVDGLIDLAAKRACDTIVVGRNALPWYRERFHEHPADELVKRARGRTLWIVGSE